MKARILLFLFETLMSRLDPQMVKEIIDDLIDPIEAKLEASGNAMALQVIKLMRDTLSIPDDIGGDED